jgi:hypothetical protein
MTSPEHMPEAITFTRASSGPGFGTGISSMRMSLKLYNFAIFILFVERRALSVER